MAIRTWGRVLGAALGVGILAGAGQLGVGFGLGIVRLSRVFTATEENQWTAQLAWVTWFAMVSAVAGAVIADRTARRHGHDGGLGSRLAYSVFAAIGAAALVPLSMLPARVAEVPSTDPALVIGLSTGLGAVAGVFVALAVLSQEAFRWNVIMVTTGAWLLALISVAPSLGANDPLPELRLGALDPASLSDGTAQSLAVMTMPLLALVAGAAIAGIGRWLGRPSAAIAASGIAGPAMLSLAYLIAGPGTDVDRYQAAPYWGALIAVGAGTLGSVLATYARRPVRSERPELTPGAEPASTTGSASGSAPGAPSASATGAGPGFATGPRSEAGPGFATGSASGAGSVAGPSLGGTSGPSPDATAGPSLDAVSRPDRSPEPEPRHDPTPRPRRGRTPEPRRDPAPGPRRDPAPGPDLGSPPASNLGPTPRPGFGPASGPDLGPASRSDLGPASRSDLGPASRPDSGAASGPHLGAASGSDLGAAVPGPARKGGRTGIFGRRGKASEPVAEDRGHDRVTRNPEAFAEAATAFSAGRRAAERKPPPPDQPTPIPTARKAPEPAARKAPKDRARKSSEDTTRRAPEETTRRLSEDTARRVPDDATRRVSEDVAWNAPTDPGRKRPAPEKTPADGNPRAGEKSSTGGKPPTAEPRRGLFGRRKPKSTDAPPADPPPTRLDIPEQPLKPKDEEYVDWVSGLSPGRDDNPA